MNDEAKDSICEGYFDIVSKGDYDLIVDFLINNPSLDVNSKDKNGQNSLFYAASSIVSDDQCLKVTQMLINKGTDPTILDDYKQNLLFYTCAAGLLKTTQWIIGAYGLNIEQEDINKQTSLFYAVKENRIEIVKYLISQSVNVHHKDNQGINCFFMIDSNDYVELALFLKKQGVDPMIMGKNGEQLLKKANRMGYFKIVDVLLGKITAVEGVKKKYVLCHKGSNKILSAEEKEQFKRNYPDVYKLLDDPIYLKKKMGDDTSSEAIDINNF